MAGRGRADRHSPVDHQFDALATVGIDYGYLGKELEATPLLCGKDQKHRWFYAMALPGKGVGDWSCAAFAEQVGLAGHRRMILKCDSENAMLAFKRGVGKILQEKFGQEVVPEDAYTGKTSSQSNGLAEHAVNEIKGKVRSLKGALEEFLGIKVEVNHPSLTWLVGWAALSINLARKGLDGRTAWELRHGKKFTRKTCRFGEHVMFLKVTSQPGLRDRWFHGIWLGLSLKSDNCLVSDSEGNVLTARSFRRFAEGGQARDVDLFRKIKGVPWKPIVSSGDPPARVLIDAQPVVDAGDLPPRTSRLGEEKGPHRVHIRAGVELRDFGPTTGCPGCDAWQLGLPAVGHSEACRERIENCMRQTEVGRARLGAAKRKSLTAASSSETPAGPAAETTNSTTTPMEVTRNADESGSTQRSSPPMPVGPSSSSAGQIPQPPLPTTTTTTLTTSSTSLPEASSGSKRKAEDLPDDPHLMELGSLNSLLEVVTGVGIPTLTYYEPVSHLGKSWEEVLSEVNAVDFAELFNPGNFKALSRPFGLTCGGVYDLRSGWNLSDPVQRKQCWADLEAIDPYLVIGSPLCGPFSQWQNMPKNAASPELKAKLQEAVSHLEFCCEVYLWQYWRGKKFLHEHPLSARSWSYPCVSRLLELEGVERRTGHQCPFGQECEDKDGVTKPVLKPTGWMSNCPEILDEICLRCSNEGSPEGARHEHTHLEGGRAKAMERYTPQMIKAILRGLRNHYRKNRITPAAYSSDNIDVLFSFRSLEDFEAGPTLDEPQPEVHCEPTPWLATRGDKFFDDVTGFPLDPTLVAKGRVEELEFLQKLGLWTPAPREECITRTGRPPIGVRWVDTNKGDQENPEVRCRLVVQETKRVSGHMQPGDVFSATPPLECLRMMCSLAMSCGETLGATEADDVVILFLDISRAHPHCPMRRDIYTEFPAEHPLSQDKTLCGKLVMTLYGCRDAGQNFELFVYETVSDAGAIRGSTNPCVYCHRERRLSFFHHGDDFVIVGKRGQTQWLKRVIAVKLIVKDRGSLGPRATDLKEISILHRSLSWLAASGKQPERIEYAADPRHAEVLQQQLGFLTGKTKSVTTPGEKQGATPDKLKPLESRDLEGFRSATMRAGYLALDRPDLQFAAKECARGMSAPLVRHGEMLKRLVRYLIGAPNMVWVFSRQRFPNTIKVWSDTDWAGCPITRRSTSGTVITFGKHTWNPLSSTQVPISLSSAEAEYYGLVKAGSRAIGIINLARDFGFDLYNHLDLELLSDSSSAIGISVRRGVGKVRHLETGALWLQAAVSAKRFAVKKVDGKKNVADILTKYVDRETLTRHLVALNCRVSQVRSSALPNALK